MIAKDLPLVLLTVCVILGRNSAVKCARILGVFPNAAKSHHNFILPILKTLANAGHQLVVFSYIPIETPPLNLQYIKFDYNITAIPVDDIILNLLRTPAWKCANTANIRADTFLNGVLQDKNIKKLLNSNEKFDLVITESYTSQEFTFIFGHIFNAPTIGIQTWFTNSLINSQFGNTLSLSFIPDDRLPYSDRMIFLQRLNNIFCTMKQLYAYYYEYIPDVERKLRLYFSNMPPLFDLMENIALIFINDHMTADYAQPRLPNMIPVAGIHIGEEKPLPEDIKRFMDNSSDGVILFSLGTVVPEHQMEKEYFDMCINVFKKLRQKVLWKTTKEGLEGIPDNVKVFKWLPQRDVLAHPNCVLFVTHGGLLSQHEAVYSEIPVVGIPYLFDQHRNVAFYEAKEIGVKVRQSELSEETLSAAVTKVLTEPKYRANMKRLSHIFRDRPLSPAESVVFWTEYVLRHSGAPHLKTASTHLSWYQLALLDVLAVTVITVISVLCISYFICKIVAFTVWNKNVTLYIKKTN